MWVWEKKLVSIEHILSISLVPQIDRRSKAERERERERKRDRERERMRERGRERERERKKKREKEREKWGQQNTFCLPV